MLMCLFEMVGAFIKHFDVCVRKLIAWQNHVTTASYFYISLSYSKKETHKKTVDPFKSNGLSYPYHLDKFISNIRVIRWYFLFQFN